MTRVSGDDKSAALVALGDQVEALLKNSGLPVQGVIIFMDHPDDPNLMKAEARHGMPEAELKGALAQLLEDFD